MVKKASNNKNSILDKVMAVEKEKARFDFDPKQIISELLKILNDREKEVLTKRYSLKGDKKSTLDSIGKNYNITRERVRQIENIAIKKVKAISEKIGKIGELKNSAIELLNDYLGILGEKTIIKKILASKDEDIADYYIIKFLLARILSDYYITQKEDNDFFSAYRLKNHKLEDFYDTVSKMIQIFEKKKEPILENNLWNIYETEPEINFLNDKINQNILLKYLDLSKKIKKNPLGELGLIEWKSIVPKRMNDKIHLIMKNIEKPLHVREIAEEINKMGFDNKIAHPATIHNELILDDKYILVGRGIYALKKWDYEPGKVSEVVEKILKERGPMDKKNLINEVAKKKIVKKTTINLAIINNKNIKKNKEGKYYLSC